MKTLISLILLASICTAQTTHTTASQQGDNAFTGNNTHAGTETFSGPVSVQGTLGVTGTSTLTNVNVSALGNFANLEGILFADRYGNGTTTGIAGAITSAGVVNKTNIWVPSSYATTENVPGSVPQWQFTGPGSLTQQGGNNVANITFQDNRFGRFYSALDPKGDAAVVNPNVQQWFRWNVNYIAGPSGQSFNNRDALSINLNALDGGFNFNNNGYANKENYAGIDMRLTAFTPAQHVGIQSFNTSYSTGDTLSFFGQHACYGGFTANGDEGCQAYDFESFHGNVEYTGTIASGASTGSTSLTLAPTAGSGTQGSYRFLIDITKISNAGTISAVTFTNANTPVAITGVGTSFGTSNVNTTIGTAVTAPGSVTVTPVAMTNITTATSLCIADNTTFEHVTPTATTGTTFTAVFRYAHPNTAIVAAGGACGNYIEFVADRVTTAVYGSTSNVNTGGNVGAPGKVVNTLHYIIPVIRSTSNTAAEIWLTNPNAGYAAYRGQWTSGGTNTYAMYPGAQVTSVQGATATCVNNSTCGSGNIGNTFTLEPNGVAWAASDVVALPLYFSQNVGLGQMIFQNFFPQAGAANSGALAIASYGISQLGDIYLAVNNNTPASVYTAGGGVLQPPHLIVATGAYKNGLKFITNPTGGMLDDVDSTNNAVIHLGEITGDEFLHSTSLRTYGVGNTGTGTWFSVNTTNGATTQKETTAPGASSANTVCYSDSTAHAEKCAYNNGSFFQMTQTIGTGNVTTAGTAVTNGTCQAQTNITVTGTATTDAVTANIGAVLPATWQTGIVLSTHPTATNTVTVYLCNPTAGSITPAATQVNVRVTR